MYEFIVNILDMNVKDFIIMFSIIFIWLIVVSALAQEAFRSLFNRNRYVYVKKYTQSFNGRTDGEIS